MSLLRWVRRHLLTSLLIGGFLLLLAFQAASAYLRPVVRQDVDHPLFTVGSVKHSAALAAGRPVAKLGPLPLRLYRGGMAFADAREAILYLQRRKMFGDGWAVYELSGDFELDTYELNGGRWTNKTLLITRRVAPELATNASNVTR